MNENFFAHLRPSKSSLMTAYNLAKKSRKFRPVSLNHALSLAQSNGIVYLPNGDVEVPSLSTSGFYLIGGDYTCDCEDYRRHNPPVVGFSQGYLKPVKHFPCQHVIARMLLKKAWDMDTRRN